MVKRITQAEAARELDVHRSTISRLVKQNPALADAEGKVDLGEVRELRRQTINPMLQTRGPATVDPAEQAAEAAPGLSAHRARREAAKATTEELDLAERLGLTLRRDDVEAKLAEAGATIKQVAAQMVRDRAEQLARIDDPRAMENALHDMMRTMLEAAAQAFDRAARGDGKANAA